MTSSRPYNQFQISFYDHLICGHDGEHNTKSNFGKYFREMSDFQKTSLLAFSQTLYQ